MALRKGPTWYQLQLETPRLKSIWKILMLLIVGIEYCVSGWNKNRIDRSLADTNDISQI